MATFADIGTFETGGLEFYDTTPKGYTTPNVIDTIAMPGHEVYCAYLAGASSGVDPCGVLCANAITYSSDLLVGFWVRFADVTPAVETNFFHVCSAAGSDHMFLSLSASSNLSVWDADGNLSSLTTSGFVADTWHLIEVLLDRDNSGNCTVWVDGTEKIDTADDFYNGTDSTYLMWTGSLVPNTPNPGCYLGSQYWYVGADSADRLGAFETLIYQSGEDSEEPDAGDDLDTGNWDDTGELPFDDSNGHRAIYLSPNMHGMVCTDDKAGYSGPYGDSRVNGAGDIAGAAWVIRCMPEAVNGTLRYGKTAYNDTSTDHCTTMALLKDRAYFNAHVVSDSGTYVPGIGDYFQIGFGSDLGARGAFYCGDMAAILLQKMRQRATLGTHHGQDKLVLAG